MISARRIPALILLLLCVFASDVRAGDFRVLLVLSDNAPLYQRFAKAFMQDLPQGMRVDQLQHAEDFDSQKSDLIISVGVRAAYRVAEKTSQPLLAAMIPSKSYEDLKETRQGGMSAIYLDQPWNRQVEMLHAVMPNRKRIGVLYSEAQEIAGLRSELARRHGTLIARHLGGKDTLSSDLEEVLSASDVLLAVPDSEIYNANSIINILLSSYRRGIPLVGFSEAYVRAGALCAIFSTPEQLALQTADAAVSYSKTGRLPEAQYPEQYSIAINRSVASTLGMVIGTDEAIFLQLRKSSEDKR